MSFRITGMFALILCCFNQASRTLPEGSPENPNRLLNEPITVAQTEGSLSNIFSRALRSIPAPGGFVYWLPCSRQSDVKYFFPASTAPVGGILDSIVALNPDYKWEMDNGAIDVLPKSGLPPLLSVQVRDFVIDKAGTSLTSSVDELLSISEVKEALVRLNIHKPDLSLLLWMSDTAPHEIKLELHNVTLLKALNEIAKTYGSAVWEYSESDCGGTKSFSITWISH
jgi:hypothetical protein